MGSTIACNKNTALSEKKLMKWFNNKGFGTVTNTSKGLTNYHHVKLRMIAYCLGIFDYISFLESGVISNVLWNATNLF